MDVRSHRHHIDTSLRLPQGDDASLRLPDGEGLVRHGADDLGHPKDGDRDHQPLVSADRPLSGEESRGRQEGAGPRRPGHGPRQGGAGRSRLGGGVLVGGAAVAVDGQNRQRNVGPLLLLHLRRQHLRIPLRKRKRFRSAATTVHMTKKVMKKAHLPAHQQHLHLSDVDGQVLREAIDREFHREGSSARAAEGHRSAEDLHHHLVTPAVPEDKLPSAALLLSLRRGPVANRHLKEECHLVLSGDAGLLHRCKDQTAGDHRLLLLVAWCAQLHIALLPQANQTTGTLVRKTGLLLWGQNRSAHVVLRR